MQHLRQMYNKNHFVFLGRILREVKGVLINQIEIGFFRPWSSLACVKKARYKMIDTVKNKNTEMREAWTPQKAVEYAVMIEKMGTAFYEELSIMFAHEKELGEIFDMLAADEAHHQKQFEHLLETMGDKATQWKPTDRRTMPRGVTDFFAEQWAYESIVDRDDALHMALQLEKKTLEYYTAMQQLMGKNDALTELINVEKKHVKKLLEYNATGAKMRGLGNEYGGN
jgi:rubrerythrin